MQFDTFRRAMTAFAWNDVVVFELASGGRVMAFHREMFFNLSGLLLYIEDDGVSNYFDASTVSRVMGQASLPDFSASSYPFRNGQPKPPDGD